ncbi:biopolymer transporter ExbD [Aureitalea sp. L0-47]|uniref:ExbD/TolR family protein n=1 Tax=Aureitalea sp. L0-47 TaxID=2816962 RepID=UPI002237169B|nr:biopolymer transporter ExbD [Aureitalea sp. L0-47]MCW5519464.1 biopolymer transporter ExbD [Aureitalea sp. L0-47]
MRTQRNLPRVNAGSMADIAFLLLIFFLVTTTLAKDKGIERKLPRKCPPGQECAVNIKDRNIMRLYLNETGELLVNDDITAIDELKVMIMDFIDNNGDGSCEYCTGHQLDDSSENPAKAVISLTTDRLTPYAEFIALQDEISKAYYALREQYTLKLFEKKPSELTASELKQVKEAYPFLFSEADVK